MRTPEWKTSIRIDDTGRAILQKHNLPCVGWFEDAIGYYGVSTVVFDLYILVQDIKNAAQVLVQNGWNLVQQEKGKIGNAAPQFGLLDIVTGRKSLQ